MKLLKILTAFAALVSLQIAAAQWLNVPPPVEAKMTPHMAGGGVPVVAGITYLFQENFEGAGATGYDCTGSDTWTCADYVSGTVDSKYSTSGIFTGSGDQCLRTTQTDTGGVRFDRESAVYTEMYGYFLFRTSSLLASGRQIFSLSDNTDNPVFRIKLTADNTLQLLYGDKTVATVGTISANTQYHVWVHFKNGTGNAEYSVGFSTTGTQPTSGDNYVGGADSTSTAAVRYIAAMSDNTTAGVYFYYDKIRFATVNIGDNPS